LKHAPGKNGKIWKNKEFGRVWCLCKRKLRGLKNRNFEKGQRNCDDNVEVRRLGVFNKRL
jgi:hypothetical protein